MKVKQTIHLDKRDIELAIIDYLVKNKEVTSINFDKSKMKLLCSELRFEGLDSIILEVQ